MCVYIYIYIYIYICIIYIYIYNLPHTYTIELTFEDSNIFVEFLKSALYCICIDVYIHIIYHVPKKIELSLRIRISW